MDIGKAFSFVFEDEEWISKILIGGLISLIPVIGQLVVLGYALKVAQNVAQGSSRPLPRWGEFGDHLMRGLYEFVIRLVYSLPIVLIAIVFACIAAVSGGAAADSDRAEQVGALFGVLGLCLVPIMIVLGLAVTVVSFAALARYVATNNLGDALKVAEVIAATRKSPGAWLMLLVVSLLAGVAASLGLIACGFGMLFTTVYAQIVIGHALGQTVVQQGMAGPQTPPAYSYGPPPGL